MVTFPELTKEILSKRTMTNSKGQVHLPMCCRIFKGKYKQTVKIGKNSKTRNRLKFLPKHGWWSTHTCLGNWKIVCNNFWKDQTFLRALIHQERRANNFWNKFESLPMLLLLFVPTQFQDKVLRVSHRPLTRIKRSTDSHLNQIALPAGFPS